MIEVTEAPAEIRDQGQADLEYRKAYLAWTASLDPKDRALLRQMGIDRPDVCRGGGGGIPMPEGIEDTTVHGWHPGEVIEDEPEPINEDDIDRLKCYDGEILKTLLRVLIFPDRGRAGNLKAALARLVALASVLHIPGVGDKTLEHLANQIGCTRALLSFYAVQLRDFGGLDCHGGKSLKAREAYATAHLWRARPNRKKGAAGDQSVAQSRELTEEACVSD